MLSRIDLSDKEERARVTTFIAEERKLKGGDAGVDFENPFKILEKNIGLADDLEKAKKIAEEKARKEAEDKQKEEARKASKSANTTAPSVTDEQRKKAQEFVREKM